MCGVLQKSGQVLLILIVASTLHSETITVKDSVIAHTQNYIGTVIGAFVFAVLGIRMFMIQELAGGDRDIIN